MENPLAVLAQVTRALETQGIAYVVVGSFASSMRGVYRATGDIDIVADIKPTQIKPLVTDLQASFYVDEQAVRRAVARSGSFNAIHLAAIFKIDVFIPPADGFGRQQLARRQLEKVTLDTEQEVYVATAEDIIIGKLLWYRAGGEVARAQWTDVLGIIGAQGMSLDVAYLRAWADRVGVCASLEEALSAKG